MIYTIIFLAAILVLFFYYVSLITSTIFGAPTIYAKQESIKQAFELANLQKDQTILDLGCGNARSLIIASKNFKAKGIGVEISPYYFVLARINVLVKGESKNIKIHFGNILKQESLIKQTDVVFVYLFDKLLIKLAPMLFKNLKKSARVVSVAFPFPGKKALKETQNPRAYLYKNTKN